MGKDIPGYGTVHSDNPLIAEILEAVAKNMYPDGIPDGSSLSPEEAKEAIDNSPLIKRLGGRELIMELAEEMTFSVPIVELFMSPHAAMAAIFCTGMEVGAILERRAATAPVIE